MITWLMKKYEVGKLHKLVQNIKIITDYGSSLRSEFSVDGKIIGFKAHDYHNFMKSNIIFFTFCIEINIFTIFMLVHFATYFFQL